MQTLLGDDLEMQKTGLNKHDSIDSIRIESIPIKELVIDDSFFIRFRLNNDAINRYRDKFRKTGTCPPLKVQAGSHRIIDGIHRREAGLKEGIEALTCELLEVPDSDLRALTYQFNKDHGVPVTESERNRLIVDLATKDQKTEEQIATIIGLTRQRVNQILALLATQATSKTNKPKSRRRRKLTSAKHYAITRRVLAGETQVSIAKAEKISQQRVSQVKNKILGIIHEKTSSGRPIQEVAQDLGWESYEVEKALTIIEKVLEITEQGLEPVETRKLAIGWTRICSCPPSHINCLTAKEWVRHQIGVWEAYYKKHDIRDKKIHPATFPISLAEQVIETFTHEGELVVDPFVGVGTTLVAARNLVRNAVGFDIKSSYIKFAEKRLSETIPSRGTAQIPMVEDARNISEYLEEGTVSLFFTSPPYANLLNRPRTNKSRHTTKRKNEQFLKVEQYSQDERDLGTLDEIRYEKEMTDIYRRLLPILKPKGHNVINIGNNWWADVKYGRRVPLEIVVYRAMTAAGYELRNVIIWDKRNLVNKTGIFGWPSNYITMGATFEYLMDFWRPER